ncbi:hypothetical protein BX600DRAFT_275693 [Xylariales sp. PMI_506]|nr:hypothetical protein BX600DRAFT_275693 [Xylariales sp. PMI_506]
MTEEADPKGGFRKHLQLIASNDGPVPWSTSCVIQYTFSCDVMAIACGFLSIGLCSSHGDISRRSARPSVSEGCNPMAWAAASGEEAGLEWRGCRHERARGSEGSTASCHWAWRPDATCFVSMLVVQSRRWPTSSPHPLDASPLLTPPSGLAGWSGSLFPHPTLSGDAYLS